MRISTLYLERDSLIAKMKITAAFLLVSGAQVNEYVSYST